jgi:hypothetical protein
MISIQKRAPDALAKYASIFVFNEEVLLQARSQLVFAGMGADTDNAVRPMRHIALFEQEVDAIERKGASVKGKAK